MPITPAENDLLKNLREGQEAAYKKLVKEYQNKVYHTALGIVQNVEDAEDVAQDVFIKVYESVGAFREESSLGTWIYRITMTQSLDFLRKKKRKKRFGFIQSLFIGETVIPAVNPGHFHHPGVELENQERAGILFTAINKLPENQRIAFLFSKLDGHSYVEIAGIMQISLSAVESLMVRAKQNLKRLLSDYYDKNER